MQQGVQHVNQGNHRAAIDCFAQVLEVDPGNAQALKFRGVAKHYYGLSEDAIADFNLSIQSNAQDASVWNFRGDAKHALKMYSAAIADYGQAIALDMNSYVSYVNRSISKIAASQYESALADCTASIALQPENANLYYTKAMVLKFLQDYDAAMTELHKALAIKPDYAEASSEVANLKSMIGKGKPFVATAAAANTIVMSEPVIQETPKQQVTTQQHTEAIPIAKVNKQPAAEPVSVPVVVTESITIVTSAPPPYVHIKNVNICKDHHHPVLE